ncbi:unnamed protein product [Tilletia controversa]|nr:unnamed protein product [Tilletia controversa]
MNSSPAKPVDWNVEDEDLYDDQYQDNYEDELDEHSDEDAFDDDFGNEDEEEDDADVERSPAQRKRKDLDFDDEKDRNERRAPARSTSTKARGVRIPPILYKAATLDKLSRASVKIFEEEVVSRMETDNEIPSAADIYTTARQMRIWENSEATREQLDVLKERTDELAVKVNSLAKANQKLTKADLTQLGKEVAYCFYSELVTRYCAKGPLFNKVMAYLKSNALLVSENFKHQFDDLEVRRAEINPAIHESMGIDTGTKKEALPLLWLRLCKGYDVPFTTKRAYRVAVLRWIAADVSVRQKDGKPTGKFWKIVDATIGNLQKRQDQQPEEIKKQLQQIFDADKRKYGTWNDAELVKGGSKEIALKSALSSV